MRRRPQARTALRWSPAHRSGLHSSGGTATTDASGRGRHPGCCRSGFRGHQELQCVSTNGRKTADVRVLAVAGCDFFGVRCLVTSHQNALLEFYSAAAGGDAIAGSATAGAAPEAYSLLVVPRDGYLAWELHRAKKTQAGRSPKKGTKKKRSTRTSARRCQNQEDGQCKQLTVQ